jgi:endonuclease YncB( thermonuclease family)
MAGFAVMALFAGAAPAQPIPAAPSDCKLETIGTGTVRRVIDGRTFALDDGQQIRLAAIETPSTPLPGESGPRVDDGVAAKAALETQVAGRRVTLQKLGSTADRYGRIVAYVTVEDQQNSVQQTMLAQGHARVAADVGVPACTAMLLTLERAARQSGLGLWRNSHNAIRQAENPDNVLAERGRFTLVEGKVLSVRESRGTIFVNFGRRWSEDFTVTILKRNERSFAAAGIDTKKLTGRRIRVRGYVEERGGPWIEAARPEQIELIEQ